MVRKNATTNSPRAGLLNYRLGLVISGLVVIGVAIIVRYCWGPPDAAAGGSPARVADASAAADASATQSSRRRNAPDVVAVVNGQPIRREELARSCLRQHGEAVLESYVNKHLIAVECRRREITITEGEVAAEIQRMADKFKLPRENFLELIERERGINPAQYAKDIVWPMLALRRLASGKLDVTDAELQQAWEARYGPAVRVQLIQCDQKENAVAAYKAAVADPDSFGRLAVKYSTDKNSASHNGWIQPIRRHVGDPKLEDVVFGMKAAEISPVIEVHNQFVVIRCHGRLERKSVPSLQEARPQLEVAIRERKMRDVAAATFQQLQKNTKIENIFNNPALRQRFPGVAAHVNEHPISVRELAEECIDRHGTEVLVGEINRRLLEQALQQQRLSVTQQDIDAEIYRAAQSAAFKDKSGRVDVDKWIAFSTSQQGVSREVYVNDAVWPSVALKKLVGGRVEVTAEDMQKAFEANYGQRVRCLVIVMDDQRRAQRVWDMARKNPRAEHFGDLAEQYASAADLRANRGEAPPIQRHGGRPMLENAAFKLRPGEISHLIQDGEDFYILFCLGRTTPQKITLEEVRGELHAGLHERKLRYEMARHFNRVFDAAQIENYLTGEVHQPRKTASTPKQTGPVRQ